MMNGLSDSSFKSNPLVWFKKLNELVHYHLIHRKQKASKKNERFGLPPRDDPMMDQPIVG